MCAVRARSAHAERRARYERYYDLGKRRLVYVGESAGADFWDRLWMEDASVRYRADPPRRSLVVRETTRFLPAASLVLEGGCGLAANSWHLRRLGYRTLALDYAQKTLHQVMRRVPEVRPIAGDVGELPLAGASVDGYWSLGVIEHFYDGYGAIRREIRRVVRPGGYLFLTFPAMSPLRRAKARLGLYPRWEPEKRGLERFYQFALTPEAVVRDFEAGGFELVRSAAYLGVSGLCEELGAAGRWLDARLSGRGRWQRLARAALDTLVRPVSYHARLLVFHRLELSD